MNNLIKTQNRDFFKDFLTPVLTNGFNHVFNEEDHSNLVNFVPAANIQEDNEGFDISLALPGISKKDVSIEVKDEVLVVKGESQKVEAKEGETFHKKEILSGHFSRSFRLGKNINFNAVEAKFTDGILSISIPKKEEEKAKKIAIK